MTRHISKRGVALITSFEGLRLKAYKPTPRDVWTIGYGHTKGVHAGQRISRATARRFLLEDVRWAEDAVNGLGLPLTQNQFDALVSFTFNLGAGILKTEHTIGKLLRQRNWKAAADSMLLYDKQGSVTLAGLTRRRKAERALFLHRPFRSRVHQLLGRAGC